MPTTTHLDATAVRVLRELEAMTIIDAHEHLPTEAERLKQPVDALTMFSHYCRIDLLTACGVSAERVNHIFYSDAPLAERWTAFKPWYDRMANTAYVRAAHIAMEKFYGHRELRDDNIEAITAAMRTANTPGLYQRVLRDACKIETCLNIRESWLQSGKSADGLLTPVHWPPLISRSSFPDLSGLLQRDITTIEDYLDAARAYVQFVRRTGGVGCKFFVFPMKKPDLAAARTLFDEAMRSPDKEKNHHFPSPVADVFFDAVFDEIQKQGLVAAVHTGYWGDFRTLNPSSVIDLADRYPGVMFDVFHLGYPYVREAIMLAKGRGNVYLNLCWTYIISPKFAYDALVEILEMVPSHKIIGFGGDYSCSPVEKVYGHLVMAREVIARALATKIADGWFTFDGAIAMAKKMLYDNPKTLYRLGGTAA